MEHGALWRDPLALELHLAFVDGGAVTGVMPSPMLMDDAVRMGVVLSAGALLLDFRVLVVRLPSGFIGVAPLAVLPFIGVGASGLDVLYFMGRTPRGVSRAPQVVRIPSFLRKVVEGACFGLLAMRFLEACLLLLLEPLHLVVFCPCVLLEPPHELGDTFEAAADELPSERARAKTLFRRVND